MSVVAQVLAVVEGIGLVGVGVLGAFFFRDRRLYGLLLIEERDIEIVRPWSVYTGFANIIWGLGVLVGILAVNLGFPEVGRTLVAFVSAMTLVLAFVILFTEIRFWKNVIGLAIVPLLVLIALAF